MWFNYDFRWPSFPEGAELDRGAEHAQPEPLAHALQAHPAQPDLRPLHRGFEQDGHAGDRRLRPGEPERHPRPQGQEVARAGAHEAATEEGKGLRRLDKVVSVALYFIAMLTKYGICT